MKAALYDKRPKERKSIAISVAVHVVVIALIASITFRYPMSAFFRDNNRTPTERVQYVNVQPRPRANAGSGTDEKKKPRKAVNPAALLPPTTIPTALPPIPPPSASVGAVNGTGTGNGGAAGAATGVEPAMPDPRIELHPSTLRVPISTAERNDSAVKAIFQTYRDAEIAAEANRGRSPRDWTIERNGSKYGLDSQYIYLGKFKLPSAILAALPFNYGGVDGNRIIQGRNASWIQNDIYSHSQGLSEDDFRAAVKRIASARTKSARKPRRSAGEADSRRSLAVAAHGQIVDHHHWRRFLFPVTGGTRRTRLRASRSHRAGQPRSARSASFAGSSTIVEPRCVSVLTVASSPSRAATMSPSFARADGVIIT